jgi:hypothetical protein
MRKRLVSKPKSKRKPVSRSAKMKLLKRHAASARLKKSDGHYSFLSKKRSKRNVKRRSAGENKQRSTKRPSG